MGTGHVFTYKIPSDFEEINIEYSLNDYNFKTIVMISND